jgi:general secretion pathway protein K
MTSPRLHAQAHALVHRQRGAALLMAMVIVTLVATMASSMVWQQWRAVQVEGSERVRSQASWVLSGALDWARLILKEDAKTGRPEDHLGEPWALPLAEARLSTFLAADTSNNAADEEDAPEAFLSGKVEDAQAKYNLYNLILTQNNSVTISPDELAVLRRLCENAGMPSGLADGIAQAYLKAYLAFQYNATRNAAYLTALGGEQARLQAPLVPGNFDDLGWLGLDAGTVERLRPYLTLLPDNGPKVNVNTAPKEVIAAVVPNLDMGRAGRLIQARQRKPFKATTDIEAEIGVQPAGALDRLEFGSKYFEIRGRLRYERQHHRAAPPRQTGRQ